MNKLNHEPLYPMLLHQFADEFSRLEIPVNFVDETLSILYTYHDPENKYTITAKMAEFTFTYNLAESEEKTKSALRILFEYCSSIDSLLEDIETDYHIERSVRKLDNISKALLDICSGATEKNRTAVRYWLGNALRGFIARFKIPTKTSQKMADYVDKTFDPALAKIFHMSVGLVGKLGSDEWKITDLQLGISLLLLFTSKINAIRKAALEMIEQGEISQ